MNIETIRTGEVVESFFSSIDIEKIIENAIQERDVIVSTSPILQEFQSAIDASVSDFQDVNKRLEYLAVATRKFNNKRGISERITIS